MSEKLGSDARDLVESQVQAINRFPDQNPNPVLRMADDGHLTYANPASEPVRLALGMAVGQQVPESMVLQLRALASGQLPKLEITHEHRTYALLAVHVPDLGFMNIYGSDVTGEKVVERFPNENPNPVFRVDDEGRLVYANEASRPLIDAFGMKLGDLWPAEMARQVIAVADAEDGGLIEIEAATRTYALKPVRIPEFSFINVYGTDITAQKVVAKFPAQNPNPVLRLDRSGTLIYANDSSGEIVAALGVKLGDPVPPLFASQIFERLDARSREPIELLANQLTYEIVPVLVQEFDFINLYGTDISAARDLARAQAETERLLLNILPPPIAARLRQNEKPIADRFDNASLLIADIVGFTEMSSRMTPDELVAMLDEVFSMCDVLVERYGIEKVKTIGDAYMVIGGVPTETPDHLEHVADFALGMTKALIELQSSSPRRVAFRIGINTGPIVAGVIGNKRTIYDVWGDTVNVASRMESLGAPGRIHVTSAVYEGLRDRFEFEPRGVMDIKGKGQLETYFLLGRAGQSVG